MDPIITAEQSRRIRSLRLNKEELRLLLKILQERSLAAGDIEVASFQKFGQPNDVYEANRAKLKEGFILYVTLIGTNGRKLNGSIDSIFDSPNFPNQVSTVVFDSSVPLNVKYNYIPRNKVVLFLDFSKPAVLNFSFLPSQETPNASSISVSGNESTWVNGVFHEFEQLLRAHPSTYPWLHRHSVYDIVVWLIGLPLSFWICYRVSPFIPSVFTSPFLQAAVYVYFFFLTLIFTQVMFRYARWIWPLVEYVGSKSAATRHRALWGTIILGLVAPVIYDVLKWLF